MGVLDGWKYRIGGSVSRAAGAVTDYQVPILVGESAGALGADVHCYGLCKPDFSDLRIVAADGATLVPYWIESISGATPNQLALVWAKYASIGADATPFALHFGNPAAAAVSAGDATFQFFDHFTTVDGNKWTVTGTVSIEGGTYASIPYYYNGTNGKLETKEFTLSLPCSIEMSLSVLTVAWDLGHSGCFPIIGDNVAGFMWYKEGNYDRYVYANASPSFKNGTARGLAVGNIRNTWRVHADLQEHITSGALNFHDEFSGATGASGKNFTLFNRNANAKTSNIRIDWVFVRKYLVSEPALGAFGALEFVGGAIATKEQYYRRLRNG